MNKKPGVSLLRRCLCFAAAVIYAPLSAFLSAVQVWAFTTIGLPALCWNAGVWPWDAYGGVIEIGEDDL